MTHDCSALPQVLRGHPGAEDCAGRERHREGQGQREAHRPLHGAGSEAGGWAAQRCAQRVAQAVKQGGGLRNAVHVRAVQSSACYA